MEDKEFIKHSAAVHISNDVSLIQRKVWNILLANAYDDLPDKEIYQVSVREMMKVLGLESSNNLDHIKRSVEALAKLTIHWNVLGKDQDQDWGFMYFLAEARIKKGVLSYAYPPTLRKLLHNPNWYARIKLSMQNRFSTKHGLALFEICADAFIRKHGQGTTKWIPIDVFRELMGLNGKGGQGIKYPDFRDLNKYVIKPALDEVNKAEDFRVTAQFRRENKKVVAVKFEIREVEDKQAAAQKEEQPRLAMMYDQELFRELREDFLLSKSDALNVLTRHDGEYVRGNLEVVRRKYQEGKIRESLPGYVLKALELDFRPKKSAIETKAEQARKRTEAESRSYEIISGLEKGYREAAKAEAASILEGFSEEERKQAVADFEEELANTQPAMVSLYQRRKLESPMFKIQFDAWLVRNRGATGLMDLESFAAGRGISLEKDAFGNYKIAGQE